MCTHIPPMPPTRAGRGASDWKLLYVSCLGRDLCSIVSIVCMFGVGGEEAEGRPLLDISHTQRSHGQKGRRNVCCKKSQRDHVPWRTVFVSTSPIHIASVFSMTVKRPTQTIIGTKIEHKKTLGSRQQQLQKYTTTEDHGGEGSGEGAKAKDLKSA